MAYKFNPLLGVGLDKVGAGGGAVTPGGADTQVQFNDGGSFAGDSGLTYNDIAGALTVGGKTATTDAPILNLSQTWNDAATTFTGLKLNVTNTAGSNTSKLLDLQVGGSSKFNVNHEGKLFIGSSLFYSQNTTFAQFGGNLCIQYNGLSGTIFRGGVGASFGNPQSGATFFVKPEATSGLVSFTDGSTGTGYFKQTPVLVSALPVAATVGAGTRGFVSDSTSTLSSHHGQAVAGGGANVVPVYSDGSTWRIG